ncbi:DsbA family protein [Caulobacter sp. 17J65-9]|uniref:DsbA family protein n=1 Tax=Caulobacter sp. 17J65-9 TaxID=2709382 RepID=UPI0013C62D8E|nr:DsbA family protein [Caulobacter sp. 17J65-9]NEX94618.1 thioredoxin domain-containing protein [Caulobacter sp. 17J65-9]
MRLATALSAALLLAACSREPAVEKDFGDKVRAYLLTHPEVIEEAVVKLQEKRTVEAKAKAGDLLRQHAKELTADKRDFVANPNGKVTVVEFYDYRCGFCKSATPQIAELIRSDPNVRFVFKEYPIFGDVSDRAAKAMIGAKDSGKYLELHKALMAEKSLDDEALARIFAAHGLNAAQMIAKGGAKAEAQILETEKLAADLSIDGTPAFVVGDQIVHGADMAALTAAIAEAKKKST